MFLEPYLQIAHASASRLLTLDTTQSYLSIAPKIVQIGQFIVDNKLCHHYPSSSPSLLYPRKFIIISQSVLDRFSSFSTLFASTCRALSGRIIRFHLRRRPSIMISPLVFQQLLGIFRSNIYHLPSPRSCFRLPFISLSLCHYIPAAFYSISSLFHNLLSSPYINLWSFVSTFPHLPTSSPVISVIENQGDGPSIVSLPSFEGSPVSFTVCHVCRRTLRDV